MAILTKAQLEALNQSSFPDQSTEAITPAILRNYNTQTIDTLVDSLDTGSFVTSAITASSLITASVNLNTITFTKGNGTTFAVTVNTGSGGGTTDISSLNAFTASQLTINSGLNTSTASQQISIDNLNSTTASINSSITQLNASSASQQISINALNTNSGSVNSSITQLNASSASQQISIDALNTTSASLNTSASLGLTTASFSGNTLTFTKGNGTTFGVVIPDVSGSTLPSGLLSSSVTNFTDYSASVDSRINAITASGGIPAGTVSGSAQITDLGFVSSSVTASSLVTASFSGNTLTFTKGDSSTFGVVIPDVSGSTIPAGTVSGSQQIVELGFLQTSSFNSYTSSTNSSITQLNASSASQQISIDALNTNSASVNSSISQLNSATSSLFTSASLGLTTASFSGNTLTFTKGDASTFGVVIPDISGSAATTIYDTVYTGESITKGDPLYISGSQGANPIVFKADAADPNKMPVTYVSNETIGAANTTEAIILGHIEGVDLTGYVAGQTIYVAEGGGWSLNLPSGSNSVTQLLGVITKGGSGGKGLVLNPGPAQLPGLDTGKLWVGNGSNQPIEISSASFATTGSNVFIGDETFQDASGNASTLSPYSGSIVLVAKTITSGSAGLSHITASTSTQVNLIFKGNNASTGSLTISGSGNILASPNVPTAGFRRYVTNQNIALTTALPQITGSATYSPTISSNLLNSGLTFRGPASSSAWTFNNNILNGGFNIGNADATPANQAIAGGTMSNNMLLSTVNYSAYTTPLVASANFQNSLVVGQVNLTAYSSSIQANNNIFNGNTFLVNNSYFGTASTNAAQRLSLQYNVFGGINSSTLTASGSNTSAAAPREVIGNTTNGSGILLGAVLNGDNSNLYSTLVHGSNLTVTGSSAYNTYGTAGSTFIGRNNDRNGTRASSGETIFAVGTGINTSNRKTGFLIDSGSNTFVEGTLNVSGSTSFNGVVNITGSLTSSLTEGYVWVGGAGNVSTLVATSSFAGGSVPAGTVSSSAQILNYNIFATTGSNTYTGYQIIKNNLSFQEATGLEDNNIVLSSLNKSTLYIQNTSISSGYNSGSILQLSTSTGSNGYGFSGSATFQMDANYGGKTAKMQVANINGVGTAVYGFADRVEFAKAGGFPNTPADTFRVDATAIELSGSIKVNTGSSGSAGIVSVNGSLTVYNGLVTTNSIILATTQELNAGNKYPAVVSDKTNGSFVLNHNFGGNLNVAYLIINPIY